MRVSTVDNDVASLEVGLELLDEVIDSLTSLDEKNDLARALKLGNEFFNRVSPLDIGAYNWGR